MTFPELLIISIALSMDAFAVAICAGLAMPKVIIKKALVIGLYFGVFQAVMPLIGYLAATTFAGKLIEYGPWIAFVLLCLLGGKTIIGSFKKGDDSSYEPSIKPSIMLPLAIATSIDALAVGVSFAFLSVSIVTAVLFIGVTTFVISLVGVKIGNLFGAKYKSKAELAGGIVLVLIGVKILLEHLEILIL